MMELQQRGNNLSTMSSQKILHSYYRNIGVSPETTFEEWVYIMAEGTYPAYGSVTRAIRAARRNNPEWRKKHKQQQVDAVKTEVGY